MLSAPICVRPDHPEVQVRLFCHYSRRFYPFFNYTDSDDISVKDKIISIFKYVVPYYSQILNIKDYKSTLQEKLQSEKRTIRYEIVREEGPANNKLFEAVVYMDNILMGRGIGKTKKEAQQNAAKAALEKEAKA